ncbi:MAG TPA: hypothetical protein VKW78_17230 [Terriglobales bacterium]|jgi:hypothetical protein|nr:hypothetical protein [Terriglobales bacterium]
MKRKILMVATAMTLLAGLAFAEDFKSVPVVDVACSSKVKANPDAHPRECALKCQKSGYGIFTSDGRFLKFDAAGNQKITKLLESSKQKDHLRVNVDGQVEGDTIKVQSVSLSQITQQ